MQDLLIRLIVLILVACVGWLCLLLCRWYIQRQRQYALAVPPLMDVKSNTCSEETVSTVRILAFKSPTCRQCATVQAPALQQVVAARGNVVKVIDIDATVDHELAQQYRVMTVPSTVVLDARGQAHAINYGFANSQRLLAQVDDVLARKNQDTEKTDGRG